MCFKKLWYLCYGRFSSLIKYNWNVNLYFLVNKINVNFIVLICVVLKNLNDCKYKSKVYVLWSYMVM